MAGASLRIFICYRREETRWAARLLAQSIDQRLSDTELFIDVYRRAIAVGENWRRRIERAIDDSDVVIALIGEQWLEISGSDGRRKLDNPNDPVRLELERALGHDLLVIPVRLDEVRMPEGDELPQSLSELVLRQGAELRHSRWDDDVEELIESVEQVRPELKQKRLAREAAVRATVVEREEHDRPAREQIPAPSPLRALQKPKAILSATPRTGRAPLEVILDATASTSDEADPIGRWSYDTYDTGEYGFGAADKLA